MLFILAGLGIFILPGMIAGVYLAVNKVFGYSNTWLFGHPDFGSRYYKRFAGGRIFAIIFAAIFFILFGGLTCHAIFCYGQQDTRGPFIALGMAVGGIAAFIAIFRHKKIFPDGYFYFEDDMTRLTAFIG